MTLSNRKNTDGYHVTRIGVPSRFKPARDRKVNSFAVACPQCKVAPYERCLRADGTPRETPIVHPKRRGVAIQSGF